MRRNRRHEDAEYEDEFEEDDDLDPDEDEEDEDDDLDPDEEDEDDDLDPDEEEDDEDFDLRELPEATRRKVEAHARKLARARTNAEKARLGNATKQLLAELRAAGVEVGENGVQISPQKLQQLLAQASAPGGTPPGGKPAGEKEQDEEEWSFDQMPDPATEPDEFREWMQKGFQAQRKAADREIGALKGELAETKADGAVRTALKLLPGLGLEDLARHPQFADRFKEALVELRIPTRQWRDRTTLSRVCGIILPDLRASRPKSRRPSYLRDLIDEEPEEQERPRRRRREPEAEPDRPRRRADRRDVERSTVSRGGRVSIAPTRESGRSRSAPRYTREDERVARRLGISVAESAALARDDTGEEYIREQRRQRRRNA